MSLMELCIGIVPGALDGRRSIVHRPGKAIHLQHPFANCVQCPKLSVAAKGGKAGSPLQPRQ
jgi:hypothetical protein